MGFACFAPYIANTLLRYHQNTPDHYSGWVGLLEKVGTPFLDPFFSLVSYSGAHKASNGRPGYVMRPDSQMYVTLGGVWAHMAGRRRRMGSNIVGTQKGAHAGLNYYGASYSEL